jgi:hypothetical protein
VECLEDQGFRLLLVNPAQGPQEFTYLSVAISSVAFGMMRGDRWLARTIVGMLYAATLLRRGRIGDAVVAHATTNALLAAWVLMGGHWNLRRFSRDSKPVTQFATAQSGPPCCKLRLWDRIARSSLSSPC